MRPGLGLQAPAPYIRKGRNRYRNIAIISEINDDSAPSAQYDTTFSLGPIYRDNIGCAQDVEKHPENADFGSFSKGKTRISESSKTKV